MKFFNIALLLAAVSAIKLTETAPAATDSAAPNMDAAHHDGGDHGHHGPGPDFTRDQAKDMLAKEGDMDAAHAEAFFKKAGAPQDALDKIMGLFDGGAIPSHDAILAKMTELGAFDKHGDDKKHHDGEKPATA